MSASFVDCNKTHGQFCILHLRQTHPSGHRASFVHANTAWTGIIPDLNTRRRLRQRRQDSQIYLHLHHEAHKLPRVQNTIDKDVHKRKRRVVGSVLNDRSVRIFGSNMSASIDEFLQILLDASKDHRVVHVADPTLDLAMDVATKLAFGQGFDLQTSAANRGTSKTLTSWSYMTNMNLEFTVLRYFCRTIIWMQSKRTSRYAATLKKAVQARMAQAKDAQHDFFSVATEIGADEKFFASELWAEATAFLAAGGLSTATTVSSTLFYLSRYPECYSRLADEIRTTFSCSEDIQAGPQLNGCKYLRACMEEALRCAPPVMLPSWREQCPSNANPFIVDGHLIPPGTQVAVPIDAMLHNGDIFQDPYAYRPDGWLEPDGEDTESDAQKASRQTMRKAFIPFMIGDRNCAGQAMAWMELNLVKSTPRAIIDVPCGHVSLQKKAEAQYS